MFDQHISASYEDMPSQQVDIRVKPLNSTSLRSSASGGVIESTSAAVANCGEDTFSATRIFSDHTMSKQTSNTSLTKNQFTSRNSAFAFPSNLNSAIGAQIMKAGESQEVKSARLAYGVTNRRATGTALGDKRTS